MSEYKSVSARFLFFNGTLRYTVEYSYGINKWFVFKETESSGAIFIKENTDIRHGSINYMEASDILYEYLKK